MWTQTYDRLQAVFLDLVAVRSAQVGHQDDRSGACIIEVAMMTINFEVHVS